MATTKQALKTPQTAQYCFQRLFKGLKEHETVALGKILVPQRRQLTQKDAYFKVWMVDCQCCAENGPFPLDFAMENSWELHL